MALTPVFLGSSRQHNKSKDFMQSYPALSRLPVTQVKRTLIKPQATRKMSLFPRTFIADDPITSFGPPLPTPR